MANGHIGGQGSAWHGLACRSRAVSCGSMSACATSAPEPAPAIRRLGRARGGRRPGRRGDRGVARRPRPPGPRRREEALPAREDLRRRPHARGPSASSTTSGLAEPARGVPALRRPALDRPRRHPRARVARAPRLPVVRLRGAPPRPRRDGRRAGGEGRRHPLARVRGGRPDRRGRAGHRRGRRTGGRAGPPRRVRARYVVVADGANSRFGRALGTSRDRSYPLGMAIRGLLHEPVPRRAVDREPPRSPRPGREPPSRLRLGLPRRRRHRQRRRRPPQHLHRAGRT